MRLRRDRGGDDGRRDDEREERTDDRAGHVGDHDVEHRAVVSRGGRRRDVGGAVRAWDRGPCAPPLECQRQRAARHHREGGRLTLDHRHGHRRRTGKARRNRGDGERGRAAGDAAGRIADDDREHRAVVAQLRGCDRVGRRGGARDGDAAALPLIGERCAATRRNGEARALSIAYGLRRGLRSDGGRNQCRASSSPAAAAATTAGAAGDEDEGGYECARQECQTTNASRGQIVGKQRGRSECAIHEDPG